MKMSFPVEGATVKRLNLYAEICGWTLSSAHTRSEDATTISAYLGKTNNFGQAIGEYALAYANQIQRDHAALLKICEELP